MHQSTDPEPLSDFLVNSEMNQNTGWCIYGLKKVGVLNFIHI